MVEFIYRCGDITSSSNGTLSKEAMNAGSKMHRKLQKMAGSYYDAEVPLKITMKKGIHDLDVTIEGRADGIIDLRGEKNRSRKKKEIERQVIRVEDRYWDRLQTDSVLYKFIDTPAATISSLIIGLFLFGRHHMERSTRRVSPALLSLFAQKICNTADVFHQTGRVFECIGIDFLQDVAFCPLL